MRWSLKLSLQRSAARIGPSSLLLHRLVVACNILCMAAFQDSARKNRVDTGPASHTVPPMRHSSNLYMEHVQVRRILHRLPVLLHAAIIHARRQQNGIIVVAPFATLRRTQHNVHRHKLIQTSPSENLLHSLLVPRRPSKEDVSRTTCLEPHHMHIESLATNRSRSVA